MTKLRRPNIPLSCATRSIEIPKAHTPYIPPHPQRGTPYHRYVLLFLPQESSTEPISVPALSDADRFHFNVREFAAQHGLHENAGGAHMWRQVWDEGVSQIYATVLRMSSLFSPGPQVLLAPILLQGERSPSSRCHPSQTGMRIFVVSGDISSRLLMFRFEQRTWAEYIPY